MNGRTVGFVVMIATLLGTGALGLLNGIVELNDTLTPFQRSVSTGVLAYGIAGITGAAGLLARRRWAVWLAFAWAVIVTYVASTAALAYAPEASLAGAFASGIASALVGAAVVWGARVAVDDRTTDPSIVPERSK